MKYLGKNKSPYRLIPFDDLKPVDKSNTTTDTKTK